MEIDKKMTQEEVEDAMDAERALFTAVWYSDTTTSEEKSAAHARYSEFKHNHPGGHAK